DPSALHLKKELTQIRKAARVLRDPGTSSSWRQTPNSGRIHSKQQRCVAGHGNSNAPPFQNDATNSADEKRSNVNVREREDRGVFLCNWKRKSRESSDLNKPLEDAEGNKSHESHSVLDVEEVQVESLSDDDCGNECKSCTCVTDKHPSAATFKSKEAGFTRRSLKKRSSSKRRSSFTAPRSKLGNDKLRAWSKYGMDVLPTRDDFACLIGQLDDTEGYGNYGDARESSPFRSGFKDNGLANSSANALRGRGKDDDSVTFSTPALSAAYSYERNGLMNLSVDSWNAAAGSINDADDEVDDDHLDFPGRHGCGIPCYWSKKSTPKSRGVYGTCSPSLSEALRFRKTNAIYRSHRPRTHHRASTSLVPLLSNGYSRQRGSSTGSRNSDDDISTELDLEALNRFDRIKWFSKCRSLEGSELVSLCNEEHVGSSPETTKSLSRKYRPIFFDEVVGQNIVVQSLVTAVCRGRIAPMYLFQGPRGTGKTSTARVFAAALNCLASEGMKPCGVCRECNNFISGKGSFLTEVDGCDRKGISKMKDILKSLSAARPSPLSVFKVLVVKECHLLSSKTWLSLLHIFRKPLPRVAVVFITTDANDMPHAVLSRCQKHLFSKIAYGEIVARLAKISADENLDIEADALDLIASNADGSLKDAETILEQLTLLGKRITVSLVNDLMGVVSDEKLLQLLEFAMSSNAMETVMRARELLDSGVDPVVLMSQMASLIVDILAGGKCDHPPLNGGRSLSDGEVERLKHALGLLSDAEKHLRVSSERSTWFTATLLQLGSEGSQSECSRRRMSKVEDEDDHHTSLNWKKMSSKSTLVGDDVNAEVRPNFRCSNSKMLSKIWFECIDKCHSRTLRQLLHARGRLVSISEVEGGLVAHIAFGDRSIKTRAEGFLSSITNSLEVVLQRNVEAKIILLPESLGLKPSSAGGEPEERKRLETAWLQATEEEKGTPMVMRPERNQVLPQEGECSPPPPPQQWEDDELNDEMKALRLSPASPSLLHNSSFASNFSLGYESGSAPGCSGLICWMNNR
ncbi:hypothetical protein M569_01659, partial [Genlisea aurea]